MRVLFSWLQKITAIEQIHGNLWQLETEERLKEILGKFAVTQRKEFYKAVITFFSNRYSVLQWIRYFRAAISLSVWNYWNNDCFLYYRTILSSSLHVLMFRKKFSIWKLSLTEHLSFQWKYDIYHKIFLCSAKYLKKSPFCRVSLSHNIFLGKCLFCYWGFLNWRGF